MCLELFPWLGIVLRVGAPLQPRSISQVPDLQGALTFATGSWYHMVFWAKSYSDIAVSKAISWLKSVDNNASAYVDFLSPDLYKEIFTLPEDLDNESSRQKHMEIRDQFVSGVVQSILEYFFDGKPNHYEAYEKEVLKEIVNFGFGWNFTKTYRQNLKKYRRSQNDLYQKGTTWFHEVFLEKCIDANKTLDELKALHEAEEERKYQEWLDEKDSDKFRENLIDEPDERFKVYKNLIDTERKLSDPNFDLNLGFEEWENSITEKQSTVERSIHSFGYFMPPDLALATCTSMQKVAASCGLDTDIQVQFHKSERRRGEYEVINSTKFHKIKKIISQDKGFLLSDIDLPEPQEIAEVLLMNKKGLQTPTMAIKLECRDLRSFPKRKKSIVGAEVKFKLIPVAAYDPDQTLRDHYADLRNSDDPIDSYKADALADLIIDRENVVMDFIDLHNSYGEKRDSLYQKLESFDLEELSNIINYHVLFKLSHDDDFIFRSNTCLEDFDRCDFYENNGSFFDDFDHAVMKKLEIYDKRECPNKVNEFENRISPALFFALHLERLLAPYSELGNNYEDRNLFAKLVEENGLNLDQFF